MKKSIGHGNFQGGGKPRPYYTTPGTILTSCIVGAGLAPALKIPWPNSLFHCFPPI